MYIHTKFQKLKATIKSIMSSDMDTIPPDINDVVPSFDPRFRNWPQLYILHQTLEHSRKDKDLLIRTRWTTEFIGCLDIFEARLKEHHEYEILQGELEVLFKELQQFYHDREAARPEMTNATRGLYLSIEHELLHLSEQWGRDGWETHDTVEHAEDFVMTCYRRIQSLLQGITLNLLAWQDDRMTYTIDLMSQLLEYVSIAPLLREKSGHDDTIEDRSCATSTRAKVLKGVSAWISDPSSDSVYWINGMTRTVNTAIAYNLSRQLKEQYKLAASHSCSRRPLFQDSRLIIPSIAYQLAQFSWPFRRALLKALSLKDPKWHRNSHSPDLLFMSLISQPLLEIKSTLPGCLAVVIDGIDECTDKEFSRQLLEVILTRALDLPVKFVIASRPEPQVQTTMNIQSGQKVVLHELDVHFVQADIEAYFRIRDSLPLNQPRPPGSSGGFRVADMSPVLARQCGILFIWAASLHQEIYITGNYRTSLIKAATFPYTDTGCLSSEAYYMTIKTMYSRILQVALGEATLNEVKIDVRWVLYLVACSRDPLEIHSISKLLKLHDTNRVWAALQPFKSWFALHAPEDRDIAEALQPLFPDYILDHSGPYSRAPRALSCLQYLQSIQAEFNICGLKSSFMLNNKVAGFEEHVQTVIPINQFYAAQHWAVHLCFAPVSPVLLHGLERLISLRLLLWMEVMTLKGSVHEMPEAIHLVKKWAEQDSACSEDLRALIHDAWLFTMIFALGVVPTSTPHIYISMLALWPNYNPITKYYARRHQGMIGVEGTALNRQQNGLLATWHFNDITNSPVVSPNGIHIALGVGNDVLVLSASRGRLALPPFKGHTDAVRTVRFSPDGTSIVSSSLDCTIRVWRIQDGVTAVGPIHGHAGIVNSVAFSPNGMHIISGSQDGTLYIWNALTGTRILGPLTGHGAISEVGYAPDGQWVVTCTRNGVVTRSAKDGQILQLFLPQSNYAPFCSIDISPDGSRIASSSIKHTIYIWDVKSGQLAIGPLSPSDGAHGLEPSVSVSFSPDGTRLVSSSPGRGLYLWDTQTGSLIYGPLEGHTGGITGAVFSPDGTYIVSGSHDKTIRLWSIPNTSPKMESLPGHANPVAFVGFSPDGAHIVSSSVDGSVCVWDSQNGDMLLSPPKGGRESRALNTYLPIGNHDLSEFSEGLVLLDSRTGYNAVDPIQVDQTIQVSGSIDGIVCVWDSQNGYMLFSPPKGGCESRVLNAYSPLGNHILTESPEGLVLLDSRTGYMAVGPIHVNQTIQSAVFSSNGTRIILGSTRNTVRVLSASTGETVLEFCPPITNQSKWVHMTSITSSPDGSRIAVGSMHYSFSIHDAHNGKLLYGPFNGYTNNSSALVFSPDGSRIASGSFSTVQVQDAQSGEIVLGPLIGHTGWVNSVDYSPDGVYIVSGARDNSICVWDAQTGEPVLGPVKWHTGPVRCVRFSPDGTRIVSGSDDKTIRVTNIRRDLDFLSDSSTPTGTDWKLNEDGWVKDEEDRLLVWVPPELRTVLMWPRTELLISTRGWLRLNFANACIGESWMECYKPPLDLTTGQTLGLDVLNQAATTSSTTTANPIAIINHTAMMGNMVDEEESR